MRIAIIGRSEYLYESALLLMENGFEIPLVVTAKEAAEYHYTAKDFEALAAKCNALFIYSAKINDPEIVARIKAKGKIDLAVSINYSGVIAQELIDLFPNGILNAHGGDLPRYRGNACMAWAILNREKKVALCIHKMIGGELDSGDIIARKYLDININTRVGETFEWMRKEIPRMMLESVKLLKKNPEYILEAQSKNPDDALRTYPRNPDDGKIDWTKSNDEILRLINASSEPFAGALCVFKEQRLVIWRAEIFDDQENYLAVAGQVSRINTSNGNVEIICGIGKIRLTEVEYNSRRTKPAEVITSSRQRLK